MGKQASFIAEFLRDGHLSIPKQVVSALSLKKGERVEAVIETKRFDKSGFLGLFGVWQHKSNQEIDLYRSIIKERESFGREEVKL